MALEWNEQPMTLAAYLELPEGSYNLIEGRLYVSPSASPWHQSLVIRLAAALEAFVRPARLGRVYAAPLDVYLREEEPAIVVQPDVLFVARDGKAQVTRRGIQGPPALAVEVLSPSNASLDAVKKRAIYERVGVEEYWMVLPDLEQVEVLRREGAGFARPQLLEHGDTLTTPLLPGFAFAIADLFEPED